MKKLLFALLVLIPFSSMVAQNGFVKEYIKTWNGQKITGVSIIAFGGFTDGVNQGFNYDGRKFFEKHFDADPYGPLGSQSWRSIYVNGEPAQGFKSQFRNWTGAFDFEHLTRKLTWAGYITGGYVYSKATWHKPWRERTKREKWFLVTDLCLAGVVKGTATNLGFRLIRS